MEEILSTFKIYRKRDKSEAGNINRMQRASMLKDLYVLNQKFNNFKRSLKYRKKERREKGRGEERERGVGQGRGKEITRSQLEKNVLDMKYCEITMAIFLCK